MTKKTNTAYSRFLANCKRRNIENKLTFDDFMEFQNKTCVYCGSASSGIDRLNNKLGYILDNCVSCCSTCNRMKGTLHPFIFLEHISKINISTEPVIFQKITKINDFHV